MVRHGVHEEMSDEKQKEERCRGCGRKLTEENMTLGSFEDGTCDGCQDWPEDGAY